MIKTHGRTPSRSPPPHARLLASAPRAGPRWPSQAARRARPRALQAHTMYRTAFALAHARSGLPAATERLRSSPGPPRSRIRRRETSCKTASESVDVRIVCVRGTQRTCLDAKFSRTRACRRRRARRTQREGSRAARGAPSLPRAPESGAIVGYFDTSLGDARARWPDTRRRACLVLPNRSAARAAFADSYRPATPSAEARVPEIEAGRPDPDVERQPRRRKQRPSAQTGQSPST